MKVAGWFGQIPKSNYAVTASDGDPVGILGRWRRTICESVYRVQITYPCRAFGIYFPQNDLLIATGSPQLNRIYSS